MKDNHNSSAIISETILTRKKNKNVCTYVGDKSVCKKQNTTDFQSLVWTTNYTVTYKMYLISKGRGVRRRSPSLFFVVEKKARGDRAEPTDTRGGGNS